MGEHIVKKLGSSGERSAYAGQLLSDIEALEKMLSDGMIEKEPLRIGAEQEFCLVDDSWYPAPHALKMLELLNDDHFTTEIATYNLEANLDPLELGGNCFSRLHQDLVDLLEKADRTAASIDTKILLSGILPTIMPRNLTSDFMTPAERYFVLNDVLKELRGENFELHIEGVDEVNILHDSVLFEGCNTSFQTHLQIDPDDFVNSYNWSQAIAGPVLSICTNSPLLLGKELWNETRIALFTQSIDTRASSYHLNEREARVNFGEGWARGTAADIFKENIVRFRSILSSEFETRSTELLKKGKIPKLKALNLHNGTVYRWNRPCYGVTNNKPHLRIECRYLPAGPSVVDEIANMVFWVGLMLGRPKKFDKIHERMEFKDVKQNFRKAAQYGLATQMCWDGQMISSERLILDELLPMAYRGLYSKGIDPRDAEYYLTIIENRVKEQDASAWVRSSYRKLKKNFKKTDACRALTAAIFRNQKKGYPVATWKLIDKDINIKLEQDKLVHQFMNRNVVSLNEKDSTELAISMMQWRNIHHLPIIDARGKLKGLISWTDIEKIEKNNISLPVSQFMKTTLQLTHPEESMAEAKQRMQELNIGCLPVVYNGYLTGIITRNDFNTF
ncbi:CBS domain-containing protein [Leptobacterium flavescens]|uniref:CBS domain-containing protein n=1 Tax=Leptobacterium flavescens TaxID=472055 RepID=A0A6P0UP12_9FLAO|nr:CBS domain-containing protein [Leptobacterium flavescens]NER14232.1 CBS domain-containing protein [Leptobacterium flavescens]